MKYSDIEQLSDSDCFELTSDSRLRIAKIAKREGMRTRAELIGEILRIAIKALR